MKRKIPKVTCQVVSIQYVHDPEAAEKWFDLYTDIILKQIQNRQETKRELEVLDD